MRSKREVLVFILGVIAGVLSVFIVDSVVNGDNNESDAWEDAWLNSSSPVPVETITDGNPSDEEADTDSVKTAENA